MQRCDPRVFLLCLTFFYFFIYIHTHTHTHKEFCSVQSLNSVQLFATPWIAVCQASLSITNSCSLLKPMSIESVMPSNLLILCHPLLLLPSVFPYTTLFRSFYEHVMYGCESWTVKKAECQRIDALELWWRRLLRVPWTARRSGQSILKEISPEYSLKGLMLKLKLQYFSYLM